MAKKLHLEFAAEEMDDRYTRYADRLSALSENEKKYWDVFGELPKTHDGELVGITWLHYRSFADALDFLGIEWRRDDSGKHELFL